MKLQAVVAFAVLVVLLGGFTALSLAAPLPQGNSETEENNSFDEADLVTVSGYIIGEVQNSPVTETIDYFQITNTEIGKAYQASLTIDSPDNLKLRMVLWNGNQQYMDTSASSATSIDLSWTANSSSHYVRIEAVTVSTATAKTAEYRLDVFEIATTPTPTNSPTPTSTPQPGADDYEPNDSLTTAYNLPVATSANATDANFFPVGDEDWFSFYVKSGRRYRASTSDLVGVDTYLEIYSFDGTLVGANNDGGGGFASKFEWQAGYDGNYYIKVTNLVDSDSTDTYDLTLTEIGAAATATPTPQPAPISGIDSCENNSDFDHACTLAPGEPQTFNFVSPFGAGADNDYYRIWVKPGLIFECKTSNLAPGVDPNLIVYDANRNAIGGNDDVEPGNYNSYFSYYATYEGWLYLLVGTGDRTPPDIQDSNYTFVCNRRLPSEATATAMPEGTSTPTPKPGTPTATPKPVTPTPTPGLTVRTLATPTPAPVVTAGPTFVPVSLLIYYDGNQDGQPGAGEGIAGISVQAYEAASGQLLGQGFTDNVGALELTVSAQGPVRVSVPFFGFSQLLTSDGGSVYLRVPSMPGITP
jgi:hypothetical protein